MLISIIIPVYNVELYIERCIDSVMGQTYLGEAECIIVNDGSTDGSMAIIGKKLAKYAGPIKFHVFQHQQNRGQSAARNTGTHAAQGDYVFYLDSDDALTPDCIERLAKEVESHPDVEMVVGSIDDVCDSKRQRMVDHGPACYVNNNDWIRYQFFKADSGFMGLIYNRLIKTEFLRSNALFFKEGVIHEDDHWSFYVYKKLQSLAIVSECTYLRYIRPCSTMTTMTEQKSAKNLNIILKDWVRDFDGFGRSLQVYMCLELFLVKVLPFLSKKDTKMVYYRFLRELVTMGKLKIALYYFVNRWVKWRYYRLSYVMVPGAHRIETKKCATLLHEEI